MSTLILIGKIAGTAALATGALVTGVSATGSSAPAADSAPKVSCARFPGASEELKAKLKQIRAMPQGEARRKALSQLRKDVRAGTYGEKAQAASYRRELHRLRLLAKAPDTLKADLKAAAKEPAGEERRAAIATVWKDAAAGKYGEDVQKIAKRAVARFEACHEKRSDEREQKQAS